jgi:hypothetical protein
METESSPQPSERTMLIRFLLFMLAVAAVLGILHVAGVANLSLSSNKRVADASFGAITSSTTAQDAGLYGAASGTISKVAPLPGTPDSSVVGTTSSGIALPVMPALYNYEVQSVPAPTATVDVYRRTLTGFGKGFLDEAMAGVLNTSKLKTGAITNLNFNLSDPAFMVTVQSDGETNMMSQDSLKFTAPIPPTQTPMRTMAGPDTIAIANKFLDKLGVNRSAYGEPIYSPEGGGFAPLTNDNNLATYTYVSVAYPDKINGKPVFDTGGLPFGITLQIHDGSIDTVMGITRKTYEYSAYPAKTVEDIKTGITQGGMFSYQAPSADAEKVILTEKIDCYVRVQQYAGGVTSTLYVPGYAYKNPKSTAENLYIVPQYVVVPLVKGLDSQGVARPLEAGAKSY